MSEFLYEVSRLSRSVSRFFLIVIGVFLIAAGINVFYTPNGMVAGGVSGLGIIIMYYSQKLFGYSIPVSVSNIALNAPLFIIAYFSFGRSYFKRCAAAVVMLSVALEFTDVIPVYKGDLMLASIFGGILTGVGVGLVLNASATTGGTDTLAHLIHEKDNRLSVSDYIFFTDAIIIVLGFFVFGAEKAMFAIISVFVASKCVSAVTSGASTEKCAIILSQKSSDICSEIRRVECDEIAVLNDCSMYKYDYSNTLICVFSQNEISHLREIIKSIDSQAFIILFDINEVFGNGYKKL